MNPEEIQQSATSRIINRIRLEKPDIDQLAQIDAILDLSNPFN